MMLRCKTVFSFGCVLVACLSTVFAQRITSSNEMSRTSGNRQFILLLTGGQRHSIDPLTKEAGANGTIEELRVGSPAP